MCIPRMRKKMKMTAVNAGMDCHGGHNFNHSSDGTKESDLAKAAAGAGGGEGRRLMLTQEQSVTVAVAVSLFGMLLLAPALTFLLSLMRASKHACQSSRALLPKVMRRSRPRLCWRGGTAPRRNPHKHKQSAKTESDTRTRTNQARSTMTPLGL